MLPVFSELLLQVLLWVRMKPHLTVTQCILIKFKKLNLTLMFMGPSIVNVFL